MKNNLIRNNFEPVWHEKEQFELYGNNNFREGPSGTIVPFCRGGK